MRARLTLPPGAPGTRELLQEYGDRLLYVRYRYDPERNLRFKTAEIIVDEQPWAPRATPDALDYVHVQLPEKETLAGVEDVETGIRRLGGAWHPPTRTWRLTYGAAAILHLTHCIVDVSPETVPIWGK